MIVGLKMNKLVIFPGSYPYDGAIFFEEELKKLCQNFDIVLYTTAISKRITRFVPDNCEIIKIRKKKVEIITFLTTIIKFFSRQTVSEIRFAKKLGYSLDLSMIKSIFISYYLHRLTVKALQQNNHLREDYLYYSYWLLHSAVSLAFIKKNRANIRIISRAHGFDAFIERGYLPFRREIFINFDEIFFVSESGLMSTKNNIFPHFNQCKSKLSVARLGTKSVHFSAITQTNNDVFTIVTCSNIIQLKRLDIVIEVLRNLDFNINWIHFGDGVDAQSIKKIAQIKFAGKINIKYTFAGKIDNQAILDFYSINHVDLFLNTSDYEGVPVSIMEALSFGIPVVCRNVGGNSEIIINDFNGFCLPVNYSPKDIANVIAKYKESSPDKISQFRNNSRRSWENEFSSNDNYNRFVQYIKKYYRN